MWAAAILVVSIVEDKEFALVYATIFGFDYVILAFLIFLLIISIAKNFAKK